MKHYLLLLLFALLSLSAALPQFDNPLRVTQIDESSGYGQEVVVCGIQDSYGLMWFGTWNGLCRYDGYQMKNYRMSPGDRSPLRTNHVIALRELNNHDIECTMEDAMTCIFHRRSETFERTNGKRRPAGGIFSADIKTIQLLSRLSEFKGMDVRFLTHDRQGGIWVFTYGGGLYRVWKGSKELKPLKVGGKSVEWVRALYFDRQHRMWIADKNGYVRMGSQYVSSNGQLSDSPVRFGMNVYCFFQDSNGDIWLGTRSDGLVRFTPNGAGKSFNLRHYLHNTNDLYSLSNNAVYAIAEDNRNRLWIGTLGGGLNMLDL